MQVAEIFESIQGEGAWVGWPALFIRLAGCNLRCKFCDTKYAYGKGEDYSTSKLTWMICNYLRKGRLVVFTGGEPLLQANELVELLEGRKYWKKGNMVSIETNGSVFNEDVEKVLALVDYVVISPKEGTSRTTLESVISSCQNFKTEFDVKVVTDGKMLNYEFMTYATMLMPLTTGNSRKDKDIKRKVWNLCQFWQKRYSPRLQVDLFGKGAVGV